jgi:hypothetical protein
VPKLAYTQRASKVSALVDGKFEQLALGCRCLNLNPHRVSVKTLLHSDFQYASNRLYKVLKRLFFRSTLGHAAGKIEAHSHKAAVNLVFFNAYTKSDV